MNHPARDVVSEIEWMAEMGLDFIDLTLEPPRAACQNVDLDRIRGVAEEREMEIVGHTAYYLPLASPFESIRRAAVEELKQCIGVFGKLGVAWMNIHPDRNAPMHERAFVIQRNLESLRELLGTARDCRVGLMVENLPGQFNTAKQLGELLEALPELGLHLDIGHCNLLTEFNTADEVIRSYGPRLRHVHLHDNKGGSADLHLPLGTGTINLAYHIALLQAAGYDGTITLEVFSSDRHYLAYSRDVLRRAWDEGRVKRTVVAQGAPSHERALAQTGGLKP
ncbi:MAG: sugar phosphate isomerase/epimerase [Verrucomicrobia subdivision 3 bacterium]|nr:sugar phosphate isomerase/epimerase [Limisphaerales bacterium]